MLVEPLGDTAILIRDLDGVAPISLALWVRNLGIPGFIESTSSYETVAIFVDPLLQSEALRFVGSLDISKVLVPPCRGTTHEVPVCYELGPDLLEMSQLLNIDPSTLITRHTSKSYTCYAVGFCPGFPFLGYLPSGLQGTPRRKSPRVRVPQGAVGITGKQTGIYHSESPGGWNLIGLCPLIIADLNDRYFPIEAGDKVRFRSISPDDYRSLRGQRL